MLVWGSRTLPSMYYQLKLTWFSRRRLTASMSSTIKQLNKILKCMINCLLKLTAASRGFACDSTGFLSTLRNRHQQKLIGLYGTEQLCNEWARTCCVIVHACRLDASRDSLLLLLLLLLDDADDVERVADDVIQISGMMLCGWALNVVIVSVVMLRVSENELSQHRQDCHQRLMTADDAASHGQSQYLSSHHFIDIILTKANHLTLIGFVILSVNIHRVPKKPSPHILTAECCDSLFFFGARWISLVFRSFLFHKVV